MVVEKSSLQSRDIHLDYGAEFSGIIKAGVVNNLSCDMVLQIRGPTKDLGPLDGTLAHSKLVTPTIPHLIPSVTKRGDFLQDIYRTVSGHRVR